MNSKPQGISIALGLIAGLIGGVVSSQFLTGAPVCAEKIPQEATVIRAEKFEVVDELVASFTKRTKSCKEKRLSDYP